MLPSRPHCYWLPSCRSNGLGDKGDASCLATRYSDKQYTVCIKGNNQSIHSLLVRLATDQWRQKGQWQQRRAAANAAWHVACIGMTCWVLADHPWAPACYAAVVVTFISRAQLLHACKQVHPTGLLGAWRWTCFTFCFGSSSRTYAHWV